MDEQPACAQFLKGALDLCLLTPSNRQVTAPLPLTWGQRVLLEALRGFDDDVLVDAAPDVHDLLTAFTAETESERAEAGALPGPHGTKAQVQDPASRPPRSSTANLAAPSPLARAAQTQLCQAITAFSPNLVAIGRHAGMGGEAADRAQVLPAEPVPSCAAGAVQA